MFQIKICGITTVDDALLAAAAGADAIGLNFYAKSARFIEPMAATKIDAALPAEVCKVGVFVNAPREEILATFHQVGLDAIQLHGDEPPSVVAQLRSQLPPHAQIIRAFRCQGTNLQPQAYYLQECQQLGSLPDAVLLDAFQPGEYGGTGQVVDWHVVECERPRIGVLPLILAGGLVPENVAAAILAARPDAVDTASGVESSPGRKDPARVRDFIAAARAAFTR